MKRKKRKPPPKKKKPLTARQKEYRALVRAKKRRDRLFRERELHVLHTIDDATRQLCRIAESMKNEMVRLAARIAPLVHDLRNGNAELLMTADAVQAKEYYRNGH